MQQPTDESGKGKTASAANLVTSTKSETPSLTASTPYIKRQGWEHRPIPEELTRLPDNVTIPERLQQIIIWSLVPGSDWSFPPPKAPAIDDLPIPNTLSKGNSQSSEAPLLAVDTTASTLSINNVSTSSFKTARSEPDSDRQINVAESEKSLKSKLLYKIGFGKSGGRPFLAERTVKEAAPAKAGPPTAECTSCFEELPEDKMTRLKSCRHLYCGDCLSMLIVTAMAAEVSFPPKCCLSPIPLKQVLKALDGKQREDYQAKAAEYAVPAADRWYCPNKDCLKWIPPNKLKSNKELGYDCPHCSSKLCRTCRGEAHAANTECPQDFGLEAILETAEIEGWQRCYKCRTMVEHSTGCRHMTCRCRAEFCYVCGLRWQTCRCTETDAANKRAGAQRRRTEAAATRDEEAAEIARAIAEVEELELREAEERRVDEERRQREEEEQLQLLEVIRLVDESRRERELEQAERDLQAVLVSSFEEEWRQMDEINRQIMSIQSAAINARHQAEDIRLDKLTVKDEEDARQEYEAFTLILKRNSQIRRNRLTIKHKLDTDSLAVRQEEAEDDFFLQVQLRLRGKANKESRMERMEKEIRKQQEDENQELETQQKLELVELEEKIALDNEGLRKWYDTRFQQAKEHQLTALRKFGYQVGADRQYCEVVFERRTNMLQHHRQRSVSSIEDGEEPIGLTEYEASKIQPLLPELDDGQQGPSGISRGPKIIMTPHGPLTMRHTSGERDDDLTSEPGRANLADGQHALIQQQLPRLSIPGSFPGDEHRLSQPLLPPRHPQHQMSLVSAPHRPPPPPPPMLTVPSPQRKPVPSHNTTLNLNSPQNTNHATSQRQSIASAMPAITMASLAAGMALQTISQHQYQPSQNQQYPSTPTVTVLDQPDTRPRTGMTNPISSPSSLSALTTAGAAAAANLTSKKSRWGFMKVKEVTEDEMRRRLKQSVGDAF